MVVSFIIWLLNSYRYYKLNCAEVDNTGYTVSKDIYLPKSSYFNPLKIFLEFIQRDE